MKYGKRITALTLTLMMALALSGCGGDQNGSGKSETSGAVSTSGTQAEASLAEPTAPAASASQGEGTDVTADYQDQLMGTYDDDYGARYSFNKGGKLIVLEKVDDKTETTEGEWWVWKEQEAVYLYTSLRGTAHPSRYTFEVAENGVLSLYDDTTGELSNLLTPSTCGTY